MAGKIVLFISFILMFTGLKGQPVDVKDTVFESNFKLEKISEQQSQNLFKLCKIWGFLKYKHPEIVNGNIDWDKKLFEYLNLTGHSDFEQQLLENLPPPDSEIQDSTKISHLAWTNDDNLFSKKIQHYLSLVAQVELNEKQQYLEPGKWDITPSFKEHKYPNVNFDDDGIRLLTLFRYWNIIEYYFPYKNLMDENWDTVLVNFIPKMLKANKELSYKLTLLELVCKINDGHGGIHNDKLLKEHFGVNQIPIELKLIKDKAYVVSSFDKTLNLEPGDEILAIEGQTIKDLVSQKVKYIPASTTAARNRTLSEYILRTNKSSAELKLKRKGRLITISANTDPYNPLRYVQRKIPSFRKISDEIVCIYPGSLKQGELDSLLLDNIDKASIILDYRCYPSAYIQNVLPYFLLPFPKYAFKGSRYSRDEIGEFTFTKSYKWGGINESYYKGKFVILVNEYTQSQPEFEILIYAQAPNVTVIGSSTAGAIGNWTPIYLPGNILTSISGNGIFRYDESPVQRIGIIPDIYVEQTLDGIKSNRDEVLERAIEYCER